MVDKLDLFVAKLNFRLSSVDLESDIEKDKALGINILVTKDDVHLTSEGIDIVIKIYKRLHREFMEAIKGIEKDTSAMEFLDTIDGCLTELKESKCVTVECVTSYFETTLRALEKYDR